MGLPTVAVLEEEVGARDGSNSAAAISGHTNDPADLGDIDAILEERAKKALECPCLDDLRGGPCGGEFSTAFLCFVKSQQPEKGSDCVAPFEKMQHCMNNNADKFLSAKDSDTHTPMARQGYKPPSEEDESEAEDEDDDVGNDDEEVDDDSSNGVVPAPPQFPSSSVRLPPWYQKKVSDNNESSDEDKTSRMKNARSAGRAKEERSGKVLHRSKQRVPDI